MKQIVAENPNRVGWPPGYLHHAKEGRLIDSGLALLASGQGFRALWTDAETKRPLTRNGVHDATGYGAELYEAWESLPEGRSHALAITMPRGAAVLDVDDGTPWNLLGRPDAFTATETSPNGWHQFVSLPEPFAFTSRHAVGELRAGPDAYTIISPSPGYEHFTLGDDPANTRWFRDLPADGSLWINHQRAGFISDLAAESVAVITDADCHQANMITTNLLKGMFAHTVGLTLRGEISGRYQSRSEADLALLIMATHHEATEGCLHELLQRHSRKLRDKTTTAAKNSYANAVVSGALAIRAYKNHERLISIAQRLSLPTLPLLPPNHSSTTTKDHTVYVMPENGSWVVEGMNERRKKERGEMLTTSILEWAGMYGLGDGYDRANGWRRLPVEDLGAVFGYGRETVRVKVLGLVGAGLIERDVQVRDSDKGPRRDTLIRLRQ